MARRRRKSKKFAGFFTAVLIVAALAYGVLSGAIPLDEIIETATGGSPQVSTVSGALNPDAEFAVHFIDVGQADSVYIKAGEQNILIDAGEKESTRTNVCDYLRSLGVEKLDYVIGTHPHADHIGGMQEVVESFEIGTVILPRLPDALIPTTRTYTGLLEAIAEKGISVSAAQDCSEIELSGGAKLTFLGPLSDYEELNSMSVCVKFSAAGYSVLLCGDAEKDAEKDMLASGADLKCNILKLSHHGSSTSNTKEFLEAAFPDCFVISVGEGNSYNHPTASVLERVNSYGKPVYRTDLNGTIVFEFLPDNQIKTITER